MLSNGSRQVQTVWFHSTRKTNFALVQWYCMSCFMRSKLTRMTGCLEQLVPRYLPYEFKDHFRMTTGTFQILSAGNKSSLEPLTAAKLTLGSWNSHRPVVTAHECTSDTDRPLLTIHESCNDKCLLPCWTWKIPNSEVLGVRMGWNGQMERSISIGPVQPRKVVHLERWTAFFETFPVGPNRSIQF